MNTAIVGFGSNIEPEENISLALALLKKYHSVLCESEIVLTKPIGYINQPDFHNGAVLIHTQMSFETLKSWLKGIENRLGRRRTSNKNGPRTIDLDIVIWNGTVVDPNITHRTFLKNAILELLPNIDL